MSEPHSDALVFFGATGDLAYKKIFPSLQAMVKRGTLNVPVVGVAKSESAESLARAAAVKSSNQEAITLPRRQTSVMSRRLRSYW